VVPDESVASGERAATDESGGRAASDEPVEHAGTDESGAHPGTDESGAHPGTDESGAHPGTDESAGASGSAVAGSGTEQAADPVVARLDDALERVAHGATVSVPSILLARGLTVAFTAVLTNGFTAGAYGVFAVARRLQQFLLHLALGFRSGLSRFLPNADSTAERNALVTVASVILVGVATVFGAALFLAAPLVTRVTDQSATFETVLRVFALGLPATVWLFTATEVLRGLEEVGALNLVLRVGFPLAQLSVGVAGVVVFDDLVAVAVGVVAVSGLVGVAATAWLVSERELRPRLRASTDESGGNSDGAVPSEDSPVWRRYLRYTFPLFLASVATTVQRLGFYPLIALYLTDVAGGVFAVGVLIGGLVRLPLLGINQFIPPVAAALHEGGHREALSRLYHVTSRIVLVGVTALSVPALVYREAVMGLFGPTFVEYAPLLIGFVLAQYGACAAGSVGILLRMTDNQRALLVVNTAITFFLAVTAVPLTVEFGLPGLVASFFLMLTINNGLEVAALYYLEGLQPFTRLHARPVLAAVPMAAVAVGIGALLARPVAPVVGTVLGLITYALALRHFGFTPVERRLAGTLAERYRAAAGAVAGRIPVR